MIDPITAFAVAQGAIKGIQAAIKMGKDIQGITHDVMKFFDAKDAVAKEAIKDPKKKYSSDTSQAMSTVMQLHELNKAEEELKWHFINQGQSALWGQIVQERNSLVQRRKVQEILDAKAAQNRKNEIDEVVTMALCVLVAAAIFALVGWGILELKGH
jgi:hypothetical protein